MKFPTQKYIFATKRVVILTLILILTSFRIAQADVAQTNFTLDDQAAALYGVHEISLIGDESVFNPFDTISTVTFTPPSGETNRKTVDMFYDGGDTWRARVYVNEVGEWRWQSASLDDGQLDGKSGTFIAAESDLRGMLKPHTANPRQWMTDDGQTFLNINDTAYRLFNQYETRWQAYVQDVAQLGITSVRAGALGGFMWIPDVRSTNYPWEGDDYNRYDLEKFQTTDKRLQWMLDHYPNIYVQLIPWGQIDYRTDEVGTEWFEIPAAQRENTLRYMVARWAAYPQIFWLGVNDLGCSEEFPNNRAFGRQVGQYLAEHDPWGHLVSISPSRGMPFCYTDDEDRDWVSYIHLEDGHALGAELIKQYRDIPVHVFLGEDYYEQDHPTRYPRHPAYSQRWLFWSWLLSGGSASYGGRYPFVHPYTQSGEFTFNFRGVEYGALTGLDSAPYIRSYFTDRDIDLALFEPDDERAQDTHGQNDSRRPELMRRGYDEFLIYHPNALEIERFAQVDPDTRPGVTVDLSQAEGLYSVEWYRPRDGATVLGSNIGGGGWRDLVSPWRGADVVLRLVRIADVVPSPTPAEDTGRVTDGLAALYTFFENGGLVVHDTAGSERPIDLYIDDPAAVTWMDGGLRVDSPTVISAERQIVALSEQVIDSNEITIEAWIRPSSLTQDGPARIITLSSDASNRNFTLGQGEGTETPAQVYNVRLRSTATSANGQPSLSTPPDSITDSLTHVVYTRDASGEARLYLNGQRVTQDEVGGDLSNWGTDMVFALGNEITRERPWLGEYRLVAVYSRALSEDEVVQNWRVGADPDERPTG